MHMMILPPTVEYPREIGRGTHGVVYRALWKQQTIAMKCIPKRTHSREMWKKEIDMMCALEDVTGVPSFMDALETRDAYCILMEHMRGRQGASVVHDSRNGGYPTEDLLRTWVKDMVGILGACHERGIVYNDVKPDNVLVTPYQAHVVDLGSCRMYTRSQGKPIGTPYYFAPEKFMGYNEYASDVWSLGITLYLWACGHHPFYRNVPLSSPIQMKEHLWATPLLFPEDPWDHYSPLLKDLLTRILRKHPRDRMGLDTLMYHPWLDHY